MISERFPLGRVVRVHLANTLRLITEVSEEASSNQHRESSHVEVAEEFRHAADVVLAVNEPEQFRHNRGHFDLVEVLDVTRLYGDIELALNRHAVEVQDVGIETKILCWILIRRRDSW